MERRHIPQLDAVRGIAILLVMATHYVAFEPWSLTDRLVMKAAEGGWIGVDLFFVLSGFLITGILLSTKESPNYLQSFFARRALRIFPLYFLFVGAVWVVATVTDSLWLDRQGWFWTYTVNFLLASDGQWAAAPLRSGHLWSLAIEEQFYLLWPFIVWKLSRRQLVTFCLFAIGMAFALRVNLRFAEVNSLAIFVSTPTRIDTLLMGALAAVLVRGGSREYLRTLSLRTLIAGSAVLLGVLAYERNLGQYGPAMQTVGFTAIAAVCAAAIVLACQSDWRVLKAAPLRFMGKYSYALYMLHGAAFFTVGLFWPTIDGSAGTVIHLVVLRAITAAGLAALFALASWHLIEKRFLRLKDKHSAKTRDDLQPVTNPAGGPT